jgi:pimeloyl-ACP methyl ester carboxylesterase
MTSVAFAHATGFCGAVWRPVVEHLPEGLDVRVWDFPCHGSAPRLDHPIDWWSFGEWALDQVAPLDGPLIGVGHSMGGASLVMAELLSPGRFDALVLVEPIIFPPPFERREGGLAEAAQKRKPVFDSRLAARENFASKSPFNAWHPAAFAGYIECGLTDTEEGVRLSCLPEDEAEIYRAATVHRVWDRLGEIVPPTLIMAGANSDTHQQHFVQSITARMRRAGFEMVPSTGHFLPMEKPDLLARRIEAIAKGIRAA